MRGEQLGIVLNELFARSLELKIFDVSRLWFDLDVSPRYISWTDI